MSDQSKIEEIIKQIYKIHEESGLYNDSLENVLFKFTNAYDSLFLDSIRDASNKAKNGKLFSTNDYNINFDLMRQAYRACIKFAYESCKHGAFEQKVSKTDKEKYQKELEETISFNYIRNTIDRYKLKKYSVSLNNDTLCFTHKKGSRPLVYDLYSRLFANVIPGGKDSKDNVDVFNLNFELANQSMKKQEFQSKKIFKPAKHILLPIIDRFVEYFLRDLDYEIGFLKGKDYYLGDYLLAYSYLAAIGFFKTAYLLSLRGENDLVNQPCIVYPKDRLISDISETTGMSEEIAKKAMEDMVYDYSFHKDKITIYQPVFDVGNYYICSCNVLFHSYIVDKIMKYFDIRGTNKPDLTLYHKYMSDKMNDRLAYYLPIMYPNLKTYKNCILKIGNKTQSEIDLLVFDEVEKTACLVELKNYTPVDNDADAIIKENRINEAIQSRLVKDKRVLDNLELFFKQNKIPKKFLTYEFSSLLVTDSFTGGVNIREEIKVIDEALFYNLLKMTNGNLKATLKKIEDREFFKMLEETIVNKLSAETYTYKGISIKVNNQ